MRSEAAQMKGLSEAGFMTSLNEKLRDLILKTGDLVQCLPVQQASVHLCINSVEDRWLHNFIPLIRKVLGKSGRLRLRIHYGKVTF
jgi:hypothetical protein